MTSPSASTQATPPAGNWLVVDTAAGPIQLGIPDGAGNWRAHQSHSGEALGVLAPAIASLRRAAGLDHSPLDGFIYAMGPGSQLGLRLAAITIEALRRTAGDSLLPVYGYHVLEVASRLHARHHGGPLPDIVAPWRGDRWHWLQWQADGTWRCGPVASRTPTAFAPTTRWLPLKAPPQWPAPADLPAIPYLWDELPQLLAAQPTILQPLAHAAPWLAETPQFATWHPVRHSATPAP
jgi:hypothetical protein